MANIHFFFSGENTKLDDAKQKEVERRLKGLKLKMLLPPNCFDPKTEKVINPRTLGPLLVKLLKSSAPALKLAPKVRMMKVESIKILGKVKVSIETELYGPYACHIDLLPPKGVESKPEEPEEEDEGEESSDGGPRKKTVKVKPQPAGNFARQYVSMLKTYQRQPDRKLGVALQNLDKNKDATKTISLAKLCLTEIDATVTTLRSDARGQSRGDADGAKKSLAFAKELFDLGKTLKVFAQQHAPKRKPG